MKSSKMSIPGIITYFLRCHPDFLLQPHKKLFYRYSYQLTNPWRTTCSSLFQLHSDWTFICCNFIMVQELILWMLLTKWVHRTGQEHALLNSQICYWVSYAASRPPQGLKTNLKKGQAEHWNIFSSIWTHPSYMLVTKWWLNNWFFIVKGMYHPIDLCSGICAVTYLQLI